MKRTNTLYPKNIEIQKIGLSQMVPYIVITVQ